MKRIALRLVILVAPMVLALATGLAGCGDDHHRRYNDRDRNLDRHEQYDRDRHDDHDGDRH